MTEEHVCEDGGEIIQDHMSSTSTTNWSGWIFDLLVLGIVTILPRHCPNPKNFERGGGFFGFLSIKLLNTRARAETRIIYNPPPTSRRDEACSSLRGVASRGDAGIPLHASLHVFTVSAIVAVQPRSRVGKTRLKDRDVGTCMIQ